jgi:hypothetical protein
VREAVSRGADLTRAAEVAVDQRIGPLLWRALAEADCLDELGESQSLLAAVAGACRVEAQLLVPRALSLALGPLGEVGVEPVVLKGPAVAARYPAPGLRPMDDIDLLLPHEQHQRAAVALHRAGWRTARGERHDLYDTVFVHDDVPSMAVELHYALEGTTYRVRALDADALWRRRVPVAHLGAPAFGLAPEDELLVLCAHAGKPHHNFSRLVWVADLAMITGWWHDHDTSVDWDLLARRAVETRCAGVVAAALALARRIGVESPHGLLPLPADGWRGDAMDQLLDVTYPLSVPELPGYHLQYALADTWWRRVRILAALLGSGHGLGARGRALKARWRPPVFSSPARRRAPGASWHRATRG